VASDSEKRKTLIDQYQDYVQYLVGGLIKTMNLPPDLFDEFVAAGNLGLVEAAQRYDSESGTDFSAFAYLRIRGAVIDSIRECADLTGKAYRFARALQAINDHREDLVDLVEPASNQEDTLARVMDYAATGTLCFRLSISDVENELEDDGAGDPERALNLQQDGELLRQLVLELPDKERRVIEDYYYRGHSLAQISRNYDDFSKSWVSRLHSRALQMLKDKYVEAMAIQNP
jgi:RNA polymerase sigma factor for flagellar operon FliA